jgi:hypothetical protein
MDRRDTPIIWFHAGHSSREGITAHLVGRRDVWS